MKLSLTVDVNDTLTETVARQTRENRIHDGMRTALFTLTHDNRALCKVTPPNFSSSSFRYNRRQRLCTSHIGVQMQAHIHSSPSLTAETALRFLICLRPKGKSIYRKSAKNNKNSCCYSFCAGAWESHNQFGKQNSIFKIVSFLELCNVTYGRIFFFYLSIYSRMAAIRKHVFAELYEKISLLQ